MRSLFASFTSFNIRDIKQKYEAKLLALPDAVSVGIGLDDQGEPAIVVGLRTEQSESRQKGPSNLEGYQVIYKTTGDIKAL